MKLYRLDSLRFIAALLVIFVHFRGDIDSTYTNLDSIRSVIVLWIKNGSAGVSLFLVLSAFLFTVN